MNCREVTKVLQLFIDGELESRTMREVALHVTQCGGCGEEMRRFERLQELVAAAIGERLEALDTPQLWERVAEKIGSELPSWKQWGQQWWQQMEFSARPLLLGGGMVAALVLFLFLLWPQRAERPVEVAAALNNQARIDSLSSSGEAVALWSEPENNTTVIWVVAEAPVP